MPQDVGGGSNGLQINQFNVLPFIHDMTDDDGGNNPPDIIATVTIAVSGWG